MEIKLDQAQSQSVYQLLAQRNLEAYQQEVERMMIKALSPRDTLQLVIRICDTLIEREKDKLRDLSVLLRKYQIT